MLVEVDDAGAAEHGGAPGDGASVIAVRRRGDRDLRDRGAVSPGEEVGRGSVRNGVTLGEVALEDAEHGVGAAERLEALQAEALALVLVVDAGEAERAGEPGERHERGRAVARPGADLGLRGAKRLVVEHAPLLRPVWPVAGAVGVVDVARGEAGEGHRLCFGDAFAGSGPAWRARSRRNRPMKGRPNPHPHPEEPPKAASRRRFPERARVLEPSFGTARLAGLLRTRFVAGWTVEERRQRFARTSNHLSRKVTCSPLRTKSRMKVLRNSSMWVSSGRTA